MRSDSMSDYCLDIWTVGRLGVLEGPFLPCLEFPMLSHSRRCDFCRAVCPSMQYFRHYQVLDFPFCPEAIS